MKLMAKPALLAGLILLFPLPVLAGSLTVEVAGAKSTEGRIGCSLFSSPEGFPTDRSGARGIWATANPAGAVCVFNDVAPGVYAVSVSHDVNENGKTDTNFFGIPTEDWGVSNNVRPGLRAPRFDEAQFEVDSDQTIRIDLDG